MKTYLFQELRPYQFRPNRNQLHEMKTPQSRAVNWAGIFLLLALIIWIIWLVIQDNHNYGLRMCQNFKASVEKQHKTGYQMTAGDKQTQILVDNCKKDFNLNILN